ncbi:exported hypothetical protein [uncultured Desulfobacterium sp.]|uniref:Secretin/TonB short N-terminal domain-containing protein n=1 Tax=uncultured Desulfobacterium sp. TaxID=201089 RepID=A0A445MYS4_9BACT|nr:exported hypothetical protein [uncultured Desulfobacterium sp.]
MKDKIIFAIIQISVLMLSVCFAPANIASPSSLSVNINETLVDIQADGVLLFDVIKAITDKAEIKFESSDSLTELVSLDIRGESVEDCIRRLLGNRSFTLTFKKVGSNQFVPINLEVFGSNNVAVASPPSPSAPVENSPPPPQYETSKKYEWAWFKQAFGNTDKLLRQISATPVGAKGNGSYTRGIRVTDISKDSAFNQIGTKPPSTISRGVL